MTGPNPFANRAPALSDPAQFASAFTPSDINPNLPFVARAVWVGTAGNLSVVTVGGSSVIIPNASGLIPIAVTQIPATGTSASGIVVFS